MATKRWKHQLFRAIPSFQLCRHAHRNQIVSGNTVPASIYQMSPVNPKSFDISYPSYSYSNSNSFAAAALVQVPPSTPEETFFTAAPPFRRSSKLKPHHLHVEDESSLPEFQWKKDKSSRLQVVAGSCDRATKSYRKKAREETDTETTLLSPETCRSFSEVWSSTSADLFSDRSGTSAEPRQPYKVVQNYPPEETVVVVKRSENPLEDFKSSMWEMVVEKRLFKPDDLEQLLLSFLSLNSRRYHGVIVEAFSEIWRVMFS